ncbi:MAG: hypothetical protein ACM37U_04500 [Gemmatimonas sp.]
MTRSFVRVARASLLIALLAGCAGDNTSPAPLARIPDGNWGGQGIGFSVDGTGVTFIFDCAGGRVDQPIALGGDGSFDVQGTYTGFGNAIGADHTPHPARYTGHATRTQVQITRTLLDGNKSVDTFTANFGALAMVAVC